MYAFHFFFSFIMQFTFSHWKTHHFIHPWATVKIYKNGYCNFICSKTGSNVDDGKTHNIAIQLVNLQQCSKQVAFVALLLWGIAGVWKT